MEFLTPLFLAGLAAVSVPIALHMLRRTPKGRVLFSSLMFLEPSPPTVTKRSRIQHWLLLVLRALALVLIALAFARPFFRSSDSERIHESNELTAVLMDVSGSMQREGLWLRAVRQAEEILKQTNESTPLALCAFDRELKPLIQFEDWRTLQPEARREVFLNQLKELKPGWKGTDLGHILPEAASVMSSVTNRKTPDESNKSSADGTSENRGKVSSVPLRLIVITDMQRGSRIESLQAFDWPAQVRVEFRNVQPETAVKAHGAAVQVAGLAEDRSLRIRIDNADDSPVDRFRVRIEKSNDLPPSAATSTVANSRTSDATATSAVRADDSEEIVVPPGESRMIRRSILEGDQLPAVVSLKLSGDETNFDNAAWFVSPPEVRVPVEYIGPGSATDAEQLRYYLESAFQSVSGRKVTMAEIGDAVRLTIAAQTLTADEVEKLTRAVRSGRKVVCIGTTVELCRQAFELAGLPRPEVEEATTEGYSLLADIDFSHPLFVPFREAKHADFSKLPIWKHRRIELPLKSDGYRILARLEEGQPGILELGPNVTLFTFGWIGADSRFVLSTKFIPLLNVLLEQAAPPAEPSMLTVGDKLVLNAAEGPSGEAQQDTPQHAEAEQTAQQERGSAGASPSRMRTPENSDLPQQTEASSERLFDPQGRAVEWRRLSETPRQDSSVVADQPGVYRLERGTETIWLAANLDPLESRTAVIGLDELRSLGVPLRDASELKTAEDAERQLENRELESRQRNWRWLLLGGFILLLIESWLSGRLAKRGATSSQAVGSGP